MCIRDRFSARADDLLWAPKTKNLLIQDLSKILTERIDVQASSQEERLKLWLEKRGAGDVFTDQIDLLQSEQKESSSVSFAALTVKLVQAQSLAESGQNHKALDLYNEIFQAPLTAERVKTSLANLFTDYPLQAYIKHVAASQLCRKSQESKAKPHLACVISDLC